MDVETEVEALEHIVEFAAEFGQSAHNIRPCIAQIYYNGVCSGRNPSAFAIALELALLGLSFEEILAGLVRYNTRLARALPISEFHGIVRRSLSGRYDKPLSCSHQQLAYVCIGKAACPWQKARGSGKIQAVHSAIIYSEWFVVLDPYALNLLLGLHKLRTLRGYRRPNARLIFSFQQLAGITGLKKNIIGSRLRMLEKHGLVQNLTLGTGWGSGKRGSGTVLDLVWPLPSPNKLPVGEL